VREKALGGDEQEDLLFGGSRGSGVGGTLITECTIPGLSCALYLILSLINTVGMLAGNAC
jgi:hypothetical protein